MPGNPAVPAVPSQPDPSPARPVARRTAFAEGVDRLRAAAVTEPGRLRAIGAVPALLVLAFGATAAWQTAGRAAAADDVLHRGRPLSAHAAGIHRSLADADTMASSGCLAGRQEGRTTRERYEAGIRTAAAELVTAAGSPDSASTAVVAKLNQPLPRRPVREAQAAVKEWTSRHPRARQADDAGDYRTARDRIIGMDADTSTSVSFEAVDRALASAIAHETRDFEQAARGGRGALTGLPAGASVLAVLGAAGAVLGAGRRLSEYR
ncbi:hypothetical protein ACPCIY_21160 [Streptomyces thermodiastaticus]